jgi:hypothetical protein
MRTVRQSGELVKRQGDIFAWHVGLGWHAKLLVARPESSKGVGTLL